MLLAPRNLRRFTERRRSEDLAGVEVAIVCTPHPLHKDAALAAMNTGAHVLVEKPLATTVADCDEMIAAAARNGVRLGAVSQRRFFEPIQRMKAAIDAGKIGRPVLGTVNMFSWRDEAYYKSDPWRGKWDTEGGGVLINQAPHHLDILQWLMGPIEEVTGRWANLNHPYVEVEDTAMALVRFRGGGTGHHHGEPEPEPRHLHEDPHSRRPTGIRWARKRIPGRRLSPVCRKP